MTIRCHLVNCDKLSATTLLG